MSDRAGNWALNTVGICRAGSGSAMSGQCREVPDSVGQGRAGPRGANKGRSVPNSAGQDLAWSTLSGTGQRREGQCSAVQRHAG